MKTSHRILIIGGVVLVAAIAAGLWSVFYGLPIIRDREYRALIAAFQQAQRRENMQRGGENTGWDFQLRVQENQTTSFEPMTVTVKAAPYPNVVRVQYEDESAERRLYEYVDYSHPAEIRTEGNTLYVHWVESLIRTDHWLMAYDLAERREIMKRRIDPADLPQPH